MNTVDMANIITDVAQKVGAAPHELDALINFETAGTYSPTIKNKYSSARGLIQIVDSTAQSLFKMDSATLTSKYNTFESQMYNVVLPYLQRQMPYPDKQSLYMAVFYPKYRNVDPQTPFPASVQKVNPNIRVVQDYINFCDARVKREYLVVPIPKALALLPIAGLVAAWVYRKPLLKFLNNVKKDIL